MMSNFKSVMILLGLLCALPGWADEREELDAPVREKLTSSHEKIFKLPVGVKLDAGPQPLVSGPRHMAVSGGAFRAKATLFSDGFDGSFPGNLWNAFSQGGVDVTWGTSSHRRSGNSVWWADAGSDSPANVSSAPPNAQSWMVSGPADLSGVSTGDIAFDLWLETEKSYDVFFVAASVDGTNFTALGRDDDTTGWVRLTQDLKSWGSLGDLTGKSQVWFAFIYSTDVSNTFEGAYVDDVAVTVDAASSGLNLVINQVDAEDCPNVQVIVSVTDDLGDPIQGLTEANFTLEEENSTQTFTAETAATGGNTLAVTLVLDASSSLSNQDVDNIKIASNDFIDLLGSGDQVAVYHFGSDVTLVQDYTQNRAAARAAVNALDNTGSTALYDGIFDAANHSTSVSGRRALVVMTDGRNNSSSHSLQQAIDEAKRAGVPVFTIGFGSANESVLMEIANETGGVFFQGATSMDLQTILNRIGQTLNNQYILTWRTTQIDAQSHDVTVRVDWQGQSASRTTSYDQGSVSCNNTAVCVPGPTTLCLNQERFRVEVEWTTPNGNQGPGSVAACGTEDSGILWFFNPDNWEMLVKVLDGCSTNNHYWLFYAATTTVGYTMTVTDTLTGDRKVYTNPVGSSLPAVTDTLAFATCP